MNAKNNGRCNEDKTGIGCFFTDRQQLIAKRNKAIAESKSLTNKYQICEVITL
ncbi:MAG: hypothetical protein ABIS74_25280 [Ferruginibacter sp.]